MGRFARFGSITIVLVLALLGCSGESEDGEGGAPNQSAADAGASSGSSASSGGAGGSSSGAVSAEISACRGTTATFPTPGATDYVQWQVNGVSSEALPPPGGAYFFNGFVNLTTYAADFSSSVSVLLGGTHTTVAAGTYSCADGAGISVNGLGVANASAPGADCAVTYDETVTDGGRMKGSFWAHFPASTAPVQSAGGCVHGRFDVADAPP